MARTPPSNSSLMLVNKQLCDSRSPSHRPGLADCGSCGELTSGCKLSKVKTTGLSPRGLPPVGSQNSPESSRCLNTDTIVNLATRESTRKMQTRVAVRDVSRHRFQIVPLRDARLHDFNLPNSFQKEGLSPPRPSFRQLPVEHYIVGDCESYPALDEFDSRRNLSLLDDNFSGLRTFAEDNLGRDGRRTDLRHDRGSHSLNGWARTRSGDLVDGAFTLAANSPLKSQKQLFENGDDSYEDRRSTLNRERSSTPNTRKRSNTAAPVLYLPAHLDATLPALDGERLTSHQFSASKSFSRDTLSKRYGTYAAFNRGDIERQMDSQDVEHRWTQTKERPGRPLCGPEGAVNARRKDVPPLCVPAKVSRIIGTSYGRVNRRRLASIDTNLYYSRPSFSSFDGLPPSSTSSVSRMSLQSFRSYKVSSREDMNDAMKPLGHHPVIIRLIAEVDLAIRSWHGIPV